MLFFVEPKYPRRLTSLNFELLELEVFPQKSSAVVSCVCLITELLYIVIMVVVGTFISVYLNIHTDSAPAEPFQVYH